MTPSTLRNDATVVAPAVRAELLDVLGGFLRTQAIATVQDGHRPLRASPRDVASSTTASASGRQYVHAPRERAGVSIVPAPQ